MITLYKKGDTHTIKGVQCEIKNFKVDELDYAKSLGYVTDPAELNKPKPKPRAKPKAKKAVANED